MWTKRRRLLAVALLLALPLIWDLLRDPERQLSARVLIGGIHLYQKTLSPRLAGRGAVCRFEPSCSHYSEAAIRRYGALGGTWRTVVRLAKCGPWTPLGTVDTVDTV